MLSKPERAEPGVATSHELVLAIVRPLEKRSPPWLLASPILPRSPIDISLSIPYAIAQPDGVREPSVVVRLEFEEVANSVVDGVADGRKGKVLLLRPTRPAPKVVVAAVLLQDPLPGVLVQELI